MVRLLLFVEGGGSSKELTRNCARGFSKFLEKAGLKGHMPRIVACGPRNQAYDDFRIAHTHARPDTLCFLIVDSEGPVSSTSSWEHLKNRQEDQWACPPGATEDQCHLMVQCMEAWFLADRSALERFFGQGFKPSALPGNPNPELVDKDDLFKSLARATRETTKGEYRKGSHSFQILVEIDPEKVAGASPWAKRFLDTLQSVAS